MLIRKGLIIIVVLLVSFCCTAVHAMESTSYKIPAVTISGGGEDQMSSHSYKMQDVKGQSVIGHGTTPTDDIGLGGTYTLLPPKVPFEPYPTLEAELEDDGWIQETNITREGEDIKITWRYDPARGDTDVEIHASSGPGDEYDTSGFTLKSSVSRGVYQEVYAGIAHDGNNYYFRVVPAGSADIFDPRNNSITVGKVETQLPADKYVFIALSFQEEMVSLQGILGEQVGSGGDFLWWDELTSKHNGAKYSGAWVGDGKDKNLRMGEGFILRAQSDTSVALVGRFGTLKAPYVMSLVGNPGYNLIAYPYPTSVILEDTGITPEAPSNLLRWSVNEQVYEQATYDGSSWIGAFSGVNNLELGSPRYYRPKIGLDWVIRFP